MKGTAIGRQLHGGCTDFSFAYDMHDNLDNPVLPSEGKNTTLPSSTVENICAWGCTNFTSCFRDCFRKRTFWVRNSIISMHRISYFHVDAAVDNVRARPEIISR